MNDSGRRYALYFVPPAESALYRFGAAVLGYDCYTGSAVDFPIRLATLSRPWAEVVREPRMYGFHATLRAPFYLRPRVSEPELLAAIERFASEARPLPTVDLQIASMGSFLALTPRVPDQSLQRLAADCVTAFDGLWAPLTPDQRRRRIEAGITEEQIAHLDRWGYPYVFDAFRFHMTLTGRLGCDEREEIRAMLDGVFLKGVATSAVCVDRLSLLVQEVPAPFRVVGQWSLTGVSA